MIELSWYKLGYKNYNYFLARKSLCYAGRKIFFSYSISHFQNVILSLIEVINATKQE